MQIHKAVSVIFAVFAALSVAVSTASCAKKNYTATSNLEETHSEPVVLEKFIAGTILRKNAELCLLGRDSEMHPVIRLKAGSGILALEIDGAIDVKKIPDLEEATAQSETPQNPNAANSSPSSDSMPSVDVAEYIHVIYDNVDFWLEKHSLAIGSEPAVVIENASLYSDAALTQKVQSQQTNLKFGTLVAKPFSGSEQNKDENTPPQNQKSEKIFYYDANSKSVQEAFVSTSSVSSREDDIVVSQVVESLKVTTRAVPRNELFAKAARYKPSPKVLAALNDQKIEKKTYNYKEVVDSLKTIRSGVNVNELLTVDQSKDPFR